MIWWKPIYGTKRKRLRFALVPTEINLGHAHAYVWLDFYWSIQEFIAHRALPDDWEFKDREMLQRQKLDVTLRRLYTV
jgi:hypothetical protein